MALVASGATTAVALLGATGVLGSPGQAVASGRTTGTVDTVADQTQTSTSSLDGSLPGATVTAQVGAMKTVALTQRVTGADPDVPAQSGHGRRIVFDQSDQRVWLVGDHGTVERTYPVSGSVTDNLHPGHYDVVSRQPTAIGVDNSGTMTHFVVFTYGKTGAGIGFHDLPVKNGKHVQTRAQLGTPLSHGCIRQAEPDAKALWDFAPLGTKVVVVA